MLAPPRVFSQKRPADSEGITYIIYHLLNWSGTSKLLALGSGPAPTKLRVYSLR